MKTDELIRLMAEDAPVRFRFGRQAFMALVAGTLAALALLLLSVGIRPNLGQALETARVLFKVAETLLFAILAARLVFLVGRPGASLKAAATMLLLPLVLLGAAIVAELFALPPDAWRRNLMGSHPVFCLVFVPLLALLPLAAFLIALKQAAPDDPGMAGAVAGLAASGIASAVYAWHCQDDSPLFLATWYGVATVVVTATGYMAGRRLLRW